MISALLFLQSRSLANRVRRQLGRLKRPKYLIGALLGGAYFWFFFLRSLVLSTGGRHSDGSAGADLAGTARALVEIGAAFGLMLFVIGGWLFPKGRAALDFTEAEIAFLFPAPLTRRMLIQFKLLRSQLRVLLSAAFMTLFTARFAGPGQAWMQVIAWWLVMSTLELHSLGASFTRTRWMDRGLATWQRRAAVLSILAALAGTVGIWTWASLPDLSLESLTDFDRVTDYAKQVASAGPLPWILLPFRLLIRPLIVAEPGQRALAMVPAIGLLALNYIWVVRSQVSFEEASLERARERSRVVAAVRSGHWHLARPRSRGIRPMFRLRPAGPALVALWWKNLIAAASTFSPGFWVSAALLTLAAAATMRTLNPDLLPLKLVGGVAAGLAPTFLLWGTQMMPFDFRQDLANADLLRTYPLRGWEVALGELLAPVTVLTGAQWVLMLLAAIALWTPGTVGLPGPADLLGWGVGLAVLTPVLNLGALLVTNAGVLLFPGWVRVGPGRAEGFEAIGQRMLFMLAQMLALAVGLLLPAGVFAVVFFVGRPWLPGWVVAPLAFGGAALILALEAVVGLLGLGRLFERLDLSEETVG